MEGKRIIFSTATPNDQSGIIPNEVIDFSRFNKNPVLLKQHLWDEAPLGLVTDIKYENNEWSCVPVFHGITEDSKVYKDLYDKGFIKACSIGGHATYLQTGRTIKNEFGIDGPEYKLDANGNKTCTSFLLYEISMVTLPSNPDAVTDDLLSAKLYESQLDKIKSKLTTLSTKFNNPKMETSETEEEKNKLAADVPMNLPKVIADAVKNAFKSMFSTDIDSSKKPTTEPVEKVVDVKLPKAALSSEKEEKKDADEDDDDMKAEKAAKAEKAKAKKDKADEEAAKAEKAEKEEKAAAKAKAKKEKAEDEEDEDEDDDEEDEKASKKKAKGEKSTQSAKPAIKTMEELKADGVKTAPKPEHTIKIGMAAGGKTFSELSASKDQNDKNLLGRVLTSNGGQKDIAEYGAVLNSIINDGKFAGVTSKTRLMMNMNEAAVQNFQANPNARVGVSLQALAAQFNRGEIEVLGRDNVLRMATTLSSSDTALASPALNAIEWLSLAIFKLFPNTSWKNDIPIFGADMTGKNTGVIWANIAADPAIYKGNQPASNQASYSYADTAVSLSLTPYWMQPMVWTPLTMHQLRYDQMGTGWAQAFAKWGAFMDDNLIFTLASTVPAGAIIISTGKSGYQTTAQTFAIGSATDPNAFYYNPAFTGSLISPVVNDITSTEQIYNKQNFDLSQERATLVIDPTMDALLSKDPETKSLLTRWVNSDGGEFVKYKNTILPMRSRVAIYDPATSQVKDPNGSIPSTSVSAALGFLPSTIGIGIGMLDVFMIQDPSAYGYKMSADIRMGIANLRADKSGTSLLTYGAPA